MTVLPADWPEGPTRQWPTHGQQRVRPGLADPIGSAPDPSSLHRKSWLPEPDLGPGGRSLHGAGHVGPFTRHTPVQHQHAHAAGRSSSIQGSRHSPSPPARSLHQAREVTSFVEATADLRPTHAMPSNQQQYSITRRLWTTQRPIAAPLHTCAHRTERDWCARSLTHQTLQPHHTTRTRTRTRTMVTRPLR